MRDTRFIILFIVLALIQLPLAKNCQIGPYIYISLLPAMVLCLPTSSSSASVMSIAFILGLVVDLVADGVPGLNAAAIIPVAALQKPILRRVIDEDLVARGYSFSFHNNGYLKIGISLLLCCVLYFTLYIILDSAGTRSFGFNLTKGVVSTLISFIFGMIVCGVLCPRKKR